MDVVLFCIVLVGLAVFVAAPLYRSATEPAADVDARATLNARRRAVVAELRDLEVDRASGLIDEASYTEQRGPLEAEAASLAARLGPPAD